MRLRSLTLTVVVSLLASCTHRGAVTSAAPPAPAPAPTPDPNDPKVKALAEFTRQVNAYVTVHRAAQATTPALKAGAGAAEIAAREKALAQAIRAKRARARQGDVFTPAVRPVVVAIIRGYLGSPEAAPAKEKVETENPRVETPGAPVNIKVNAPYEADASLSTVPAPLLLKLPQLPEEVEFRFVGKHLVLRDTQANIIVDYVLGVVP
jgi:hypothetical protein